MKTPDISDFSSPVEHVINAIPDLVTSPSVVNATGAVLCANYLKDMHPDLGCSKDLSDAVLVSAVTNPDFTTRDLMNTLPDIKDGSFALKLVTGGMFSVMRKVANHNIGLEQTMDALNEYRSEVLF